MFLGVFLDFIGLPSELVMIDIVILCDDGGWQAGCTMTIDFQLTFEGNSQKVHTLSSLRGQKAINSKSVIKRDTPPKPRGVG